MERVEARGYAMDIGWLDVDGDAFLGLVGSLGGKRGRPLVLSLAGGGREVGTGGGGSLGGGHLGTANKTQYQYTPFKA
ncbi:hypothetical protein P5673_023438 [Acropora cervicornis]|uniref:Uncharacterized protein n=1 Tax=Acropora cervicornis TaxID=6130 RepID=A0AAD9Q5E3_ACRCE|nr:hypothetical protein P5673_023438 [Acropora cervicornis]